MLKDKTARSKPQFWLSLLPRLSAQDCFMLKHVEYAKDEDLLLCLHLCIFPPPLAVSNERHISEAVYNPISLTEVPLDPTQAWSKGPINAADPAIYAQIVF